MKVFTAEAMATCAERGHSWHWVRTWHDVGFRECSRCGQTPPFAHRDPIVAPNVATPSPQPAAPTPQHYADAPDKAAAPAQSPAAPRAGGAWSSTRAQRAERDADICRRMALGESSKAVAALHKVHFSRVSQILKAAKKPPSAPVGLSGRDDEIRRRRAANESAEAVAAAFGISVARVYQIAPRGQQPTSTTSTP